MNQTQALARLRNVLGDRLAYRVDKAAPDAERRAEMRAEWEVAKQADADAEAARVARLETLLANDATYQELKTRAAEAKKAKERAGAWLHHYRVTVGVTSSVGGTGFFIIRAQGDNWSEVVEQMCKAKESA